jgi:competence protein ComEA
MNENEDKKKIVILIVMFLLGTITGAIGTIGILPNEYSTCECEENIEINGDKEAKGSTLELVEENITLVSDSKVSLPIPQCNITVDISGAIKEPGVYCFSQGSRVVDVIEKAKGFSKGVAYKYVSMKMNLSSLIENYQKIYIPFEEDVYCEIKSLQYIDIEESAGQQEETSNNTTDSTQSCININTATKEQLTTLDGIGESTAQKIIDARPFEKVEDILNVTGIGDATYEKFKDEICVY